jgi:IS30 family transposase
MGRGRVGGHPRMSDEDRDRIAGLVAQGKEYLEVQELVGCSAGMVRKVIVERGGVPPRRDWTPRPGRLTWADREEISRGLARGDSFTTIAAVIGKAVSTVSREVGNAVSKQEREAGKVARDEYRAWTAHNRAGDELRRPKDCKLVINVELAERVDAWMSERLWSPQQVSRRLRIEYPGDPMMRVSHETIYQSIYVQGRGALRKELAACLRTGRAIRRNRARLDNNSASGQIPGMVNISERPAEVADRAVPGHWEGDLIIGKNGKSAVGTLVERSTRFVILLHLVNDRSAETVRDAMARAVQELPAMLFKSVTWDQGKEMAQHARFTIDTGIDVYFCDPHSPWQRGSNENTNGLLRQFMPKGTDLSLISPARLREISDLMNGRPRQTLGWMTPSEKLNELLALTA